MQDPPEYFSGRYLAYRPNIPSELLEAATPPDREHPPQNMTHVAPQFDLIHHQYKQVWWRAPGLGTECAGCKNLSGGGTNDQGQDEPALGIESRVSAHKYCLIAWPGI